MKISDVEVAKAVIANDGVDCFVGKEGPLSIQPAKMVSCVGGVFWGKPEEAWPQSARGRPLIPWLQIVCAEMKGLYGPFYQREAVCLYLDGEFAEAVELSGKDKCNLVVREYPEGERLVPLDRPTGLEDHKFHQVTWEKARDYPAFEKYNNLFEDSVMSTLCADKQFEFANLSGIKIGGWPTPLQSHQRYPGEFDLQIDITENYMYGDSGVGWLSREIGYWYLMFESI